MNISVMFLVFFEQIKFIDKVILVQVRKDYFFIFFIFNKNCNRIFNDVV